MRRMLLVVATVCALGALATQAQPWIVDQEQALENAYMAGFSQPDLAQSFMQAANNINGADVKLQAGIGSGPGNITIELWNKLPNAGGVKLTEGTDVGVLPGEWAEPRWPVVNITPETTYYLVFKSTNSSLGLAGHTGNPYPRGNVFANAGYQPFPNFDYTFRTYRIPEPATLSLLALSGLVVFRRR